MSGIYEQRNPFLHADPEKFKISKIFPDKQKSKEIKFKDLRLKAELILAMHLMHLIEDKLKEFIENPKDQKETLDISFTSALRKLKLLLTRLAMENCSQDYRFAEELSMHWHALIYQVEMFEKSASPPKHLESIQLFIKKIEGYPKKNHYSLGYYLTNYAGGKWIPFPFIDILSSLHENAIIKKNKSILNDWIHTLSFLLQEVKSPQPTK